jgi:hypothetical protein
MKKTFLLSTLTDKVICLVALFSFLSFNHVAAQYTNESLLYARSSIYGTARTAGAAGAFGSVGADLGAISINPAGLGLYRSTDIAVTPSIVVNNNEGQLDGSFSNQGNVKFNFTQAGMVFTKLFHKQTSGNEFSFNTTRLNSISFGLSYQRQAGFSRTQYFEGYNNTNSGIDAFTDYVNSTHQPLTPDNYPIEMLLAYDANLIGYNSINGSYFSNARGPIAQVGKITSKGGIDQVEFNIGGNVSDKFYFGLGLGVPILTYFNDAAFGEYNSGDSASAFQDYTFGYSLRNTGVGVNAKFGFIYRPATWMRFGVAYQIPTFWSITETYSTYIAANFDTAYYPIDAYADPFKYKLRSPMKGTASLSFFLKEHGFFSFDYEFQNYGASRFDFGSQFKNEATQVNALEKKNFTFGHVLRAGFEGAYKTLRVRVGYAFSSTPYKKDALVKGYAAARNNATAGIGYRGNRFYVDFAYVFGFMKDADNPYADFEVRNTLTSHTMFLTLGYKISKDNPPVKKKQAREPRMSF